MKILLFRRTISGEDGSTKVLVWLANSLASAGHEVVVLSQIRGRNKAFYKLDKRVKRVVSGRGTKSKGGYWDRTSAHYRERVTKLADARSFGPRFLANYAAFFFTRSVYKLFGSDSTLVDTLNSLVARKSYYSAWKTECSSAISVLTRALRDERPDVVVSFFTAAHFLIAEASKRTKTPIVCFYNGDPRVYPQRIGEKFIQLSKVLRPQAYVLLDPIFHADLNDEDRRIAHVIPNYVRESPKPPSDVERSNTIISVGRLHPQKNHELLLEAFAMICRKYPHWRVEIYGEGEHRQELERRIVALGLEGRAFLKGVTADIDGVYRGASIHAFPSLCEGFGLVVIEAMSAGLPAISVEGVYPSSDFVVRSGSGVIAKPQAGEFAAKLELLIKSPQLRQEMGTRGVVFAKQFSSTSVLSRWEELLAAIKVSGIKPLEGAPVPTPEYRAGPRLPVPSSATIVPRVTKPRLKSATRPAAKAVKPTLRHAWQSPLPSRLGYPRIHPENGYDALDFLRAQKVSDLNRRVVEAIRASVARSHRRIKVGFLVSEKEKWNGDQLVQELEASPHFQYSFAVGLSSTATRLSHEERSASYEEQVSYFKTKGPIEFELFDPETDRIFPVEDMDYDVLFIQQPWGAKDYPRRLVGRMLCVYMHYGFAMMANHGMHYNISTFHSYLWKYFSQTDLHRLMHVEHDPSANDKVVVTGYPKLDVYLQKAPSRSDVNAWKHSHLPSRRRVIFAPHHSVERNSLGMATFPWSGAELARLRDRHEDIDWIYKPHPRMGFALQRARLMDADEYAAYLEGWEQSANSSVYDDGDYFDIFRSSDALITDCGSFLAEYLPTEKPIIWLISDNTVGLNTVGKYLSEGFYHVRSIDELRRVFYQVVIDGEDPLLDIRKRAIAELLPHEETSSKVLVDHLKSCLLPDAYKKISAPQLHAPVHR